MKSRTNIVVSVQPQTNDIIERIIQKRLAEGIRDSKARIISEAISALAEKESV